MGGGGAAAKPKKSVEIIVVGRGEGYSDSWIPIFDAWVFWNRVVVRRQSSNNFIDLTRSLSYEINFE